MTLLCSLVYWLFHYFKKKGQDSQKNIHRNLCYFSLNFQCHFLSDLCSCLYCSICRQHSLQPAFSISLVHRINHLKCIMHTGLLSFSSTLGWGCLDFISTPCESTVTITDLSTNPSSKCAANWNSGGIPSSNLLHFKY